MQLGGKNSKKHLFRWRGDFKGGRAHVDRSVRRGVLLWAEQAGARLVVLLLSLRGRIQRNRLVSWQGIQRGRRPLGTRSCLQGLVCYTLHGRVAGKSGCRLLGHTDFHGAAQADFAGGTLGKDRICRQQNPPVRRRQEELFQSAAEEKSILPLPGKVYKSSRPPQDYRFFPRWETPLFRSFDLLPMRISHCFSSSVSLL